MRGTLARIIKLCGGTEKMKLENFTVGFSFLVLFFGLLWSIYYTLTHIWIDFILSWFILLGILCLITFVLLSESIGGLINKKLTTIGKKRC